NDRLAGAGEVEVAPRDALHVALIVGAVAHQLPGKLVVPRLHRRQGFPASGDLRLQRARPPRLLTEGHDEVEPDGQHDQRDHAPADALGVGAEGGQPVAHARRLLPWYRPLPPRAPCRAAAGARPTPPPARSRAPLEAPSPRRTLGRATASSPASRGRSRTAPPRRGSPPCSPGW